MQQGVVCIEFSPRISTETAYFSFVHKIGVRFNRAIYNADNLVIVTSWIKPNPQITDPAQKPLWATKGTMREGTKLSSYRIIQINLVKITI